MLVDGAPCASGVAISQGETKEVVCSAAGTEVMVQLPTRQVLTICEFEVFGVPESTAPEPATTSALAQGPPAVGGRTPSPVCRRFCWRSRVSWARKCANWVKCMGCSECSGDDAGVMSFNAYYYDGATYAKGADTEPEEGRVLSAALIVSLGGLTTLSLCLVALVGYAHRVLAQRRSARPTQKLLDWPEL